MEGQRALIGPAGCSTGLSPCRGTASLGGGRGSPSPPAATSISGRSVDRRACRWFLGEEETLKRPATINNPLQSDEENQILPEALAPPNGC